ncbi:DUF134 domain-containing protein [Natranaerofaba carboxydovora]|uniref:DUF134 domain-containing protein n=1 Tax=Natranaerofaba carboxydovora TaxID=2742683 RepID=UPI001F12913F|nr:DUF134 domain-containing protein [Natranaerofaba carboxydovora]UMZ75468.1 hypothetical protein ACONDI_03096 [Natranaerofaba carboxydovora]
MPRPPKRRKVEYMPEVTYFKPKGIPLRELDEKVLTVEELEAMRLKDIENLDQQDCADRMEVSRATFQNVLLSARSKVSDALVNGKSIKIEGGNYNFRGNKNRDLQCTKKQESKKS